MDNVDNALLTILLVEDDEDDYVIISDLLCEIGEFKLEWVTDYDAALKAIKREEHDVCLLDYRLGERSGLELLREASEGGYRAPIILLTGQGDRDVDLEAMQTGAADYLVKGRIDANVLERSIRYAFTRTLRFLGESEKHFRSLVQNASDIITVIDAEATILYESPAIETVLGYEPEDLVGRSAFDHIHPDDLERVQSILVEITKRPGASEPVEARLRHADGSWRYLEGIANNLLGNPSLRGMVFNFRDVTERKQLEEALLEIREAERRRMARDLHDIVLQDLSSVVQTLQGRQVESQTVSSGVGFDLEIDALRRAIGGIRDSIHNLRSEESQPFVRTVEALVELNQQLTPEWEVNLVVRGGFPSELPKAVRVEMLRTVREALANARRHSGARRAEVRLEAEAGEVGAEISDDGDGFDVAAPWGGMGIHSMRERAAEIGGSLEITSEPTRGTLVRIRAPLHLCSTGVKQEREGQEGEVRVLLVEDHASVRQATASVFEREQGFMVVGQAGLLSEARKMLDGVDVAVIDLGLPDGYGGDLIKDLRTHNPQAQALVLSAIVDRAAIARAVESGAAGVLHKSAEMGEVVEAVRRLRAGEALLPLEEVVELLRFAGSRKEEEYEARQAIARLTPREKEVLRALAEGLDSKEIAERLYISVKTEANHMTSIINKLGVHSRLQALVFAVRHGVVEIH